MTYLAATLEKSGLISILVFMHDKIAGSRISTYQLFMSGFNKIVIFIAGDKVNAQNVSLVTFLLLFFQEKKKERKQRRRARKENRKRRGKKICCKKGVETKLSLKNSEECSQVPQATMTKAVQV